MQKKNDDKKKRGYYRNKLKGRQSKAEIGYMPLDEFRNNDKDSRRHPVYIFAQKGNDYLFFVVTHSEITSGTKNLRLAENPNSADDKVSFIRPKYKQQNRRYFGKVKPDWYLNEYDKKTLQKIIDEIMN